MYDAMDREAREERDGRVVRDLVFYVDRIVGVDEVCANFDEGHVREMVDAGFHAYSAPGLAHK
jgi:hypothetical protein